LSRKANSELEGIFGEEKSWTSHKKFADHMLAYYRDDHITKDQVETMIENADSKNLKVGLDEFVKSAKAGKFDYLVLITILQCKRHNENSEGLVYTDTTHLRAKKTHITVLWRTL
jgi:hypothetical protein